MPCPTESDGIKRKGEESPRAFTTGLRSKVPAAERSHWQRVETATPTRLDDHRPPSKRKSGKAIWATDHPARFLVPEFGKKRVDEIGLEHIELFPAQLLTTPKARKLPKRKDGRPPNALPPKLLSPKYVNSIVDTLLRLLHKAHEYRLVRYVPKLKKARVPRQHPRFFDFAQADAVLEAARGWDEEPLVPFLMRTGLRIGEALELKWSDVDWIGKRLFVARGV